MISIRGEEEGEGGRISELYSLKHIFRSIIAELQKHNRFRPGRLCFVNCFGVFFRNTHRFGTRSNACIGKRSIGYNSS